MAYRFVNPAPVFLDIPGEEQIPGGTWTFYERGTTTLKDTWSDPELTILNSNPVQLDSAARLNTDVFLDGEYSAVLRDASGVVITTKVITSGIPAGLAIPPLEAGFLTNDLSNLIWQEIREVPDPTGSANYILSTDGANLFWIPQPEIPEPPDPEVVVTGTGAAGSFQAGTSAEPKKYFRQWGNATAPANPGAKTTQQAVSFPTAFDDSPRVFITMNGSGFTNAGSYPDFGISSLSPTGFTVKFDSQRGESNSDMNISASIPFSWCAEGVKTVSP